MLLFPDERAALEPDKPAYVMAGTGETVTYAELVERSRRGARLMRALGIRTGDHIALLMENHPRLLEVVWAAQRAGIRYTPMPARSTVSECAYLLADCEARLLVTTEACREVASAALDEVTSKMPLLQVDGTPTAEEDYRARAAEHPAEPLDDEEEGIDLLYSGGTTGRPISLIVRARGPALSPSAREVVGGARCQRQALMNRTRNSFPNRHLRGSGRCGERSRKSSRTWST